MPTGNNTSSSRRFFGTCEPQEFKDCVIAFKGLFQVGDIKNKLVEMIHSFGIALVAWLFIKTFFWESIEVVAFPKKPFLKISFEILFNHFRFSVR